MEIENQSMDRTIFSLQIKETINYDFPKIDNDIIAYSLKHFTNDKKLLHFITRQNKVFYVVLRNVININMGLEGVCQPAPKESKPYYKYYVIIHVEEIISINNNFPNISDYS